MLAALTSWLHGIRHRASRSEWAIRHLGLPVSHGTAEDPGLLLIQIDGLARTQLETAIASGRMPHLAELIRTEGYVLHSIYPGLPSTTPSVQAELYYGVRCGVPAFSFQNRATGKVVSMFEPEVVKEFERDFSARGENLLKGGSSWSNIYSGGAADEECHFCISTLGVQDLFRTKGLPARLGLSLLHLPSMIRIAGLVLLELAIGAGDAIWGICRGQSPFLEAGAVLSRMCVGVAVRELLRIGGRLDLARGLPVIHMNFLGYDELSHRRGPGSWFAHWSLRGIDASIASLCRAAHRSRRRDYQVWIFSDHGQERTKSFETEHPGGVPALISECLSGSISASGSAFSWHPASRLQDGWNRRGGREPCPGTDAFSIAAMGPVAHVYVKEAIDDDAKRAAARCLVERGKIPAVLFLRSDGEVIWTDGQGEAAASRDLGPRLGGYAPALRAEIARDLVLLCRNENAGDFVLLGCRGEGECWTFAAERGSHGGIGPDETRGFLLTPPGTRLPEDAADFVRPESLRAAVFHHLGRTRLSEGILPAAPKGTLKLMSYNVHGCCGMDGRISPRRIARIISRQNPDVVALQELDRGRLRSREEDQANVIAGLLGYHVVFCPTVTAGSEGYGHAVLSRYPLETVKVADLPSETRGIWVENRRALWTRLDFHGVRIHVVTTHLGLSGKERRMQMTALLGPDWLGSVPQNEPAILCGDLNCLPGSASHRIATRKFQDVAGRRRCATFSSIRPIVRLDHIFVSTQFTPEKVHVVQDLLARVSSDHLPVVAELTLAGSSGPASDQESASDSVFSSVENSTGFVR